MKIGKAISRYEHLNLEGKVGPYPNILDFTYWELDTLIMKGKQLLYQGEGNRKNTKNKSKY